MWYWAQQVPLRLVVAEGPLLELAQLVQEHTAEAAALLVQLCTVEAPLASASVIEVEPHIGGTAACETAEASPVVASPVVA